MFLCYDLLTIGSDSKEIERFKDQMKAEFEMKDFGRLPQHLMATKRISRFCQKKSKNFEILERYPWCFIPKEFRSK